MINVSYKKWAARFVPLHPYRFSGSPIAAAAVPPESSLCFLVFSGCPSSSPPHRRTSTQSSMASPTAAAPAEFTQMEAARQSLIAISQSVSEIGRAPVIRPPRGGGVMDENGHDDVAEQRYRAKLISISNQSPDARPTPCPPKKGAA